ncbi:hpt domain protein [Desulfovibrio sp. A2]|nr:hpt domain protein [Desulfovibrio sp. A2]
MKDANPKHAQGAQAEADTGREPLGHSPDHLAGHPANHSPNHPPNHPADHPVLDRSGAMHRLELDAESYGQLLALMTVEVAGTLDALTEAWRSDDRQSMRLHAHRLKSEAANVGAEEVRFAAARLERLLRQIEEAGVQEAGAAGADANGDATAAVSHLRMALARLAAVLGQ